MEDQALDFAASPSKRQKFSDSDDLAEAAVVVGPPSTKASQQTNNDASPRVAGSPMSIHLTNGSKNENPIHAPNAPFTIPGLGGCAPMTMGQVKSESVLDHGTRDSSPSTVKSDSRGGDVTPIEYKAKDVADPSIEAPTSGVDGHVDELPKPQEESVSLNEDSSSRDVREETEHILRDDGMMSTPGHDIASVSKQEGESMEFEFEYDDDVASQSSLGRGLGIESVSSVSGESDSDASSSSDDDADSEDEYSLLDPVEQARRLMAGESDDSGAGAAKAIRTKNEKAEEVVPKPDITITPEMEIQSLGLVQTIVENIVLIQAKISGIDQALDVGSVLCLGDRKVVGVIADIFGKTEEPYYTMRFAKEEDIKTEGISLGTEVFYVPQHATYILTRPLRNMKGTDASKDNDEPGANDEVEFSDDEKEREHAMRKRAIKRQNGAVERGGPANGMSRGSRPPRGRGFARSRGQWRGRGSHTGHPLPKLESFAENDPVLKYEDDGPSDEIYRRLTRPGTAQSPVNDNAGINAREQNGSYSPPSQNGGGHRGGRGSGYRGRGRVGNQEQSSQGGHGYGQHPNNTTQSIPFTNAGYPMASQTFSGLQQPYQIPQIPYTNNNPYQYGNQNNAYQPQFPQQFPYQNFGQPQYQNFAQQPGHSPPFNAPPQQYGSNNSMPFIPPGSHINPEFFRRQSQGPPGP